MSLSKGFFGIASSVLGVALLAQSCATVNHLDRVRIENPALAANLQVPPEPKLDVHYAVFWDPDNFVASAMSLGTNVAKAASATQAETRMREALRAVDVPGVFLSESYDACASALDARKVDSKRWCDYLLDLEIREYGIKAESAGGAVALRMSLTARIYDSKNRDLIWRRKITVNDRASPSMFGLGNIVGNVVTAGVLSNLTTEQLERGFERLAAESARSVARTLEKDLYAKRYH